jgi:phage-related protein
MKSVYWIASTNRDMAEMPAEVKNEFGFALYLAQTGVKALHAVPLVGFSGAGVLEIISDFDGDTYRAVYTVKFSDAVYVLHVFKKKSKTGKAPPKQDMDLVRRRLVAAEADYDRRKRAEEVEKRDAKASG